MTLSLSHLIEIDVLLILSEIAKLVGGLGKDDNVTVNKDE